MKELNNTIKAEQIVTYYDDCEIDYKWLWHLNGNNAMHYGLWKEDTISLREALQNMNEYVTGKLQLAPGQKILDAGCGVGGTAIHICNTWDVTVHGITLSYNQVAKSEKNAHNSTLKGKPIFSVQDYCNTHFDSSAFDSVYAIESVCHANEKADFLKEAYRILKKDGILIVADFFTTKKENSSSEAKLLDKWAKSWAVPQFENTETFLKKAVEAGFKVQESSNITDKIIKSSRRLQYFFYPGLFAHAVLFSLGLRNRVQGKNVWSTHYQHKSLTKKLWEYRVITLVKI